MKKCAFLLMLLCVLFLCTAALADGAYINGLTADRVHLRKEASTSSESLGLFYTGTRVACDETKLGDEWVKASIGAQNGYIMGKYLQADFPSGVDYQIARVSASSVNFRAKPTKDSKVMRVLKQGDEMTVWGQTANDWYYVLADDGAVGYVMPKYTEMGENEPQRIAIRRVGESYTNDFIYAFTAPNGQEIFFTAMEDPSVKLEDVNFDGQDDLVVTIIRGASNFYTEFYVWNGKEYVRAKHYAIDYAPVNYSLLPDQKLVLSQANNGYAGSLFEKLLFQWDGTDLKAVRRISSVENEVHTDTENGFSIAYELNRLLVRVWDYEQTGGQDDLVYETVVNADDITDGDTYEAAFKDAFDAFWMGIK